VIRAVLRRILPVLSAGYTLMVFSERLFRARQRPGVEGPSNNLSTWIACFLAGYAGPAVNQTSERGSASCTPAWRTSGGGAI
jgi:hypothetical protein